MAPVSVMVPVPVTVSVPVPVTVTVTVTVPVPVTVTVPVTVPVPVTVTEGVELQILNTSSINIKDGVKVCVYGGSGIGKTRLCATAPAPIIFSAENGLLSLRKEKVPYVDITSYAALVEAYKWAMTSSEAKKYQTVCLDSLSEIAEVVLGQEQKKTNDGRRAYGETQQQMYQLIRDFRDMNNKNVVMICKEMLVPVGMSKCAVPIMPSEKLQAQVPYFFDLVLHYFVGFNTSTGQSYTAIHTKADSLWQAKDRSGNLDPIEYPNLATIFQKAVA
jgi:energy-coupling factor transporter ATP-binding protein EcfA2